MLQADDIDMTFVGRVRPDVAAEILDGEAVLYHEGNNTVHMLSPTATILWECLDGAVDLDTLVGELSAAYQVDREQMLRDVVAAVQDFGRRGLLVGVRADADVVASSALDPASPGERP